VAVNSVKPAPVRRHYAQDDEGGIADKSQAQREVAQDDKACRSMETSSYIDERSNAKRFLVEQGAEGPAC
jgi:hypothetical protein